MTTDPLTNHSDQLVQLVTFHVGDAICGLDIQCVKGITQRPEMTPVPLAPEYVRGILNLRGEIVTVIDLGRRVGLSPNREGRHSRGIIVEFGGEHIGLLVDRVGDVVSESSSQVDPPPASLGGVQGGFFQGVLKTQTSLVGVLDLERLLQEDA
jgi:purine-binding chemotaxis protein CheW